MADDASSAPSGALTSKQTNEWLSLMSLSFGLEFRSTTIQLVGTIQDPLNSHERVDWAAMDGRITQPAPVVLVGDLKDLLTWSFNTVSPGVVSDRAYAGTAFLGTVQLGVLSIQCIRRKLLLRLGSALLLLLAFAEAPGLPPPPTLTTPFRESWGIVFVMKGFFFI
ncbi:MAG: hypothetical protein FRX48_07590 [Lasallia pustulata]|uniref:Uncharacterized protein n=1 Tax=Lasallia pustulata TaxID=136370 RepID=A0A5M8PHQ2_9LECA|nr:MAG: hypothetical protein FRX48_07590 [Lasallia pustulata]